MNDGLYIFDLDGTLVDSYPQIGEAFVTSLKRLHVNLPSSAELLKHLSTGGSMSQILRSLFTNWSADQKQRFRQQFVEIYPTLLAETQAFAGSDEVLSTLTGRCSCLERPRAWLKLFSKNADGRDSSFVQVLLCSANRRQICSIEHKWSCAGVGAPSVWSRLVIRWSIWRQHVEQRYRL